MELATSDPLKAPLVRPASVVDGVYDRIYERLMALDIAPGARIPIDVLARELATSQTPVREALSRLEREGLVRKAHLIGYSAAPQLTRKQFDDLYAFRLLIEPEGARLAALKMTPEALVALERAARDMGGGAGNESGTIRYSRFARFDGHFHDAILKLAGNEVMRASLASQHIHLHLFRLMFHARVTEDALAEHDRLLEALRKGDGTAAGAAMRDHLQQSHARLLPAFDT